MCASVSVVNTCSHPALHREMGSGEKQAHFCPQRSPPCGTRTGNMKTQFRTCVVPFGAKGVLGTRGRCAGRPPDQEALDGQVDAWPGPQRCFCWNRGCDGVGQLRAEAIPGSPLRLWRSARHLPCWHPGPAQSETQRQSKGSPPTGARQMPASTGTQRNNLCSLPGLPAHPASATAFPKPLGSV